MGKRRKRTLRSIFADIWWQWRAWCIRSAYRKLARQPVQPAPEPEASIEIYEGTDLWHRPYDLHIDVGTFRNLLPLLREQRKEPNLEVADLVQEAITGAIAGEAKRRGLVFAGRFEEGDDVVVQWRAPAEAARLLAEEG